MEYLGKPVSKGIISSKNNSGHDKKDHKKESAEEHCDCHSEEKGDCCCVPGIRKQLDRLAGSPVGLAVTAGQIFEGVLGLSDCDSVSLSALPLGITITPAISGAILAPNGTVISVCEVNAIIPLTLTF